MVNKSKDSSIYTFADYNKNATAIAILLPSIIFAVSMLTSWLMDRKVNFFVRIIPIIFVLFLSIIYFIVLFETQYKVIGTDEKLYILRGIKNDIIKLSDIKKYMYTLNSRGYFDCNIIANEKMYDVKIYKRKEYIDYLSMHCKQGINDVHMSRCKISDRKIVYTSSITDLLFITTLNVFPIGLLITKIIANDYYWYVDKVMSLSWIFILSMIPAMFLLCFAAFWKRLLLQAKKFFITSILVISFALLAFTFSVVLQRVSPVTVTYDSDIIKNIESKISYQLPKNAIIESRVVKSTREIVVTTTNEDEFAIKFNELKNNNDFIKCNPSDFPYDVALTISNEEIDYCFVYSIEGLKENEIDYFKYDEYLVLTVDIDSHRFFIYEFLQ